MDDRRKRDWLLWITCILVIPVLYAASFGPWLRLTTCSFRHAIPNPIVHAIDLAFAPIDGGPGILGTCYEHYLDWWISLARDGENEDVILCGYEAIPESTFDCRDSAAAETTVPSDGIAASIH